MLKKGIWMVFHIIAIVALSVSLLLGVLFWNVFGFAWEVVGKNYSYEESNMVVHDLQAEASIIWDYFDAKQTLEAWEIKENASITIEEFYNILAAFGIPETDYYILVEEYGLTEDRILAFLEERYYLTPEDVKLFLEDQRALNEAKGKSVEYYVPDVASQMESDEFSDVDVLFKIDEQMDIGTQSDTTSELDQEYAIAQAQSIYDYGNMRYDVEYSNVRYEILYDNEVIDSNIPADTLENTDLVLDEKSNSTGAIYIEEMQDYELRVFLDENYPVTDYFSDISQQYNLFQTLKWILFGVAIGSVLVILLSTIALTRLAGRKKGSDKVRLSWIDQPPLEITLIFWAVVAVGVVTGIISAAGYVYYDASVFWLILYILIVLVGSGLGLTGYMSLVRRIKTRTLGKNSLCYMLVAAVVKVIRNIMKVTSVSRKIIATCTIYVIAMFFLLLHGSRLSIILAVLVSVVGLYIIYQDAVSRQKIIEGMEKITSGELDYQVDLLQVNHLQMEVAESVNQVGSVMNKAVQQSLKDERLRADLITNVSHDIKTPLTSIINYVDLLKREKIENEKAAGYLEILDQKSQRLKQLTEDLVEASKLSSGNVVLNMEKMDFNEILQQALGEFEEKFQSKNLQIVLKRPEGQVAVMGEGRRIWRILENLFQNVYKYAMPGTRVYAELVKEETEMTFSLKNISQYALNIEAEDLTERFIRGDVSRTTEGSGLGLSIARDLANLQKGGFEIFLDGDLFKAVLKFELIK